jgi:large subunit ribosomal protein L23
MNKNPYYIIKSPLLSEESTIQRDAKNQYTFKVDPRANKCEIREAIEKIFTNVKVVSVNTMNYPGKISGRRGRGVPGYRPDWKKAIVTLRKGDAIDLV